MTEDYDPWSLSDDLTDAIGADTFHRLRQIANESARIYTRRDEPKVAAIQVGFRVYDWMAEMMDEMVAARSVPEFKTKSDLMFNAVMQYLIDFSRNPERHKASVQSRVLVRRMESEQRDAYLAAIVAEVDFASDRHDRKKLRLALDDLLITELHFEDVADPKQMGKLRGLISRVNEILD